MHRIAGAMLVAALAGAGVTRPAQALTIPDCAGSVEISAAKVVRVEKNGVLVLADGRAVHIEGLRLPQGAHDRAPQFFADQAIDAINDFVRGRRVTLAVHDPKEDRYDRIRAQVFFSEGGDEPWLQVMLLRRGLARIAIDPDREECAFEFRQAEQDARSNQRGLWKGAAYAIRSPEGLRGDTGTFQIVEGDIVSTDRKDGRVYLDFGRDLQTDLTVTIAPEDVANFRLAGIDPDNYAGRRVRVRGFVQMVNGPDIRIFSPADIEVLGPVAGN